MFSLLIALSVFTAGSLAHHDNEQEHFQANDGARLREQWAAKYGRQFDLTFSGPLSYAHLPYSKCLEDTTVCRSNSHSRQRKTNIYCFDW